MRVGEVSDGVAVERNHVYVIPPNKSMILEGGLHELVPRERSAVPHHPIDEFFFALAKERKVRGHRRDSFRQRLGRHFGAEGD